MRERQKMIHLCFIKLLDPPDFSCTSYMLLVNLSMSHRLHSTAATLLH